MTAKRIEITTEEVLALLDRLKNRVSETDYQIIKALVDTHLLLEQLVSEKNTSINRLLKMIFGNKTEKTNNIHGSSKADKSGKKTKPKGHGRNGAGKYAGAQQENIDHTTLHHCDPCPVCQEGKLYRQPIPGMTVRIKGAPPLQATVYQQEKLRCNICGKVFTADLPPGTGSHKYDETASAMLAVLRYGCGLPFYRMAKLQAYIGDLFMSLIHTCALAKINPFEYLTALQKNSAALFANPKRWLPWNYKENFASPAC